MQFLSKETFLQFQTLPHFPKMQPTDQAFVDEGERSFKGHHFGSAANTDPFWQFHRPRWRYRINRRILFLARPPKYDCFTGYGKRGNSLRQRSSLSIKVICNLLITQLCLQSISLQSKFHFSYFHNRIDFSQETLKRNRH